MKLYNNKKNIINKNIMSPNILNNLFVLLCPVIIIMLIIGFWTTSTQYFNKIIRIIILFLLMMLLLMALERLFSNLCWSIRFRRRSWKLLSIKRGLWPCLISTELPRKSVSLMRFSLLLTVMISLSVDKCLNISIWCSRPMMYG